MKQDAIAPLLTAAKLMHIHLGGRDERQPCSSECFSAPPPGSANLQPALNAAHCTGFPSKVLSVRRRQGVALVSWQQRPHGSKHYRFTSLEWLCSGQVPLQSLELNARK